MRYCVSYIQTIFLRRSWTLRPNTIFKCNSKPFFSNSVAALYPHLGIGRYGKLPFTVKTRTQKLLQTKRLFRTVLQNCQSFYTSPKHCVPPIVLIILRPLTKIIGILVGRGMRKWWQRLSKEEKRLFWEQNRISFLAITAIVGGAGGLYYGSHIQPAPITHRRRFIAFTPEQFDVISTNLFKLNLDLYKEQLVSSDSPMYTFVVGVANRLLQGNKDIPQIHKKSWSISIIDDPKQNAYILPSGHIFVFTGMLHICTNENQLGIVLGHEMAHAVLGHAAETLSHVHIIDLIMMVLLAVIWAVLPSDILSLVVSILTDRILSVFMELPYNRMLELEADKVGLELSAKACFDVRESTLFWAKMNAIENLQSMASTEWLSSHPTHGNRADILKKMIPQALKIREAHNCPPLEPRDFDEELGSFKKQLRTMKRKQDEKWSVRLGQDVDKPPRGPKEDPPDK